MWRQDISVINMHERKHFTYINELHTCKMSKISFNVFCNTVHYVCVFIEDVVCICLLILLPSKVFYDWKIQQSIDWSHCLFIWCKINYNAVFNTLSSWALSVWQFSLFWYMYTDLVTIASLSSKSLFVYRLRQICECWLKNPWHLAK